MHQARHDADSYQRVEVITGQRRRRDWSDAEKARILVVKIKRKSPERLPQFQGVPWLAAGSKRLILSTS